MRMFSRFFTLAALCAVFCISNSADAQWPDYTQVGQTNYIEVGFRAYTRPGTDLDFPIFQDANTNEVLFDAGDATSAQSAPGVELSYFFQSPLKRQLEFRTILGNFDNSTLIDGRDITTPFLPGTLIDSVEYNYDSRIFSFELNAHRPLRQGISVFGGPRFVSLDDQVTVISTVDANFPAQPDDFVDTRIAEAINHLIGLQAGLRFDVQASSRIRGAGFIRAGGYFNPTTVRTSLNAQFVTVPFGQTLPPQQTLDTELTKSTGTLLVETGGKVFFDVTPNFSCFAGYEATWIDGVALGPTSFFTPDSTDVETANTLFLNAITAGMQFRW